MRRPSSLVGLVTEVLRIYLWRVPVRRRLALGALALAALATVSATLAPPRRSIARAHVRPHTLAALVAERTPRVFLTGRCERGGATCTRAADCGGARCVLPFAPRVPHALGPREGASLAISPSLAWNGDGYGVVWVDLRHGNTEIYFARLSAGGARAGAPTRITTGDSARLGPQLVWTGREYGVTWTDAHDETLDVYFARISAAGARVGEPVRLSTTNDLHFAPRAAWNGREYGVAWYAFDRSEELAMRFARVSASGERVGSDRLVRGGLLPTGVLDLAWNGREYAAAWNDFDLRSGQTTLKLQRIGEGGAVGEPLGVASERAFNGGTAMAWDGKVFGLVWEDGILEDEPNALCFASASGTSVDVRRTALTQRTSVAVQPALAWGGRDYGLAWTDDAGGMLGTYFARVTPRGTLAGAALRLSSAQGDALMPSVAWTGSEFAAAWTDTRDGDAAIYFARVSREGHKVGADVRVTE
jgi:hypothetical protein